MTLQYVPMLFTILVKNGLLLIFDVMNYNFYMNIALKIMLNILSMYVCALCGRNLSCLICFVYPFDINKLFCNLKRLN